MQKGLFGGASMAAAALLCLLVPVPGLFSQTSDLAPSLLREWSGARAPVERGLEYLRSQQLRESGAVSGKYAVAVTSLAGLAVLGAGYQPHQEPYGPMLKRCIRYILDSGRSGRGFITEGDESESRMHGHCYAVLFLCEVLGSLEPEEEEEVARLIKRAVLIIEGAQSKEGGWWYYPENPENEDEASVTVCALQALRSARNVGFHVDSNRIQRAIRYVLKCQDSSDGSFAYSTKELRRTTYALSVAAISTLNAAGVYESKALEKGLDFMKKSLDSVRNPWKAAEEEHAFYANLYAVQALYQGGGEMWSRWYPGIRDHLLSKQRANGSWEEDRYSREFATAVAVLILEVPLGYLPIFQR